MGDEDEDEEAIDAELRRLGVELPDLEEDCSGWEIPPRLDEEDWDL